MSELCFNSTSHTYTIGDTVVPGVTTLMQPFIGAEFKFVDPEVLLAAQRRGTAVHGMIANDIGKKLGWSDVAFELADYFDSWLEFKHKSGFVPILSEARVYSRIYGYAGTLDLFGLLNDRLILPDIKCVTSLARSVGPQTAAYLQALRETYQEYATAKIDRAALQLMPKGKWKIVPLNDTNDLKVFLSCINIHNHLRKLA